MPAQPAGHDADCAQRPAQQRVGAHVDLQLRPLLEGGNGTDMMYGPPISGCEGCATSAGIAGCPRHRSLLNTPSPHICPHPVIAVSPGSIIIFQQPDWTCGQCGRVWRHNNQWNIWQEVMGPR